VLFEFALVVADFHSAPASIKHTEEEEWREGREKRWSAGYGLLSTLHSPLACCAQAFTQVSPPLQHCFLQVLL